jgi:FixJ family two-component response regulator
MSNPKSIYLVDDDESFLTAMTRLLRLEGHQVSAFRSGRDLLDNVSAQARGCIVMDLGMPDMDGLQLQRSLSAAAITLPIIFLSGQGDIPSTVSAMQGGAVDFIEKHAPKEKVLSAIARALERDARTSLANEKLEAINERFRRLTPRELEVLRHVVRGRMNKQIAAALDINERTVRLHRTAITTKMGVHSAAQLATLVREAGLFESDGVLP